LRHYKDFNLKENDTIVCLYFFLCFTEQIDLLTLSLDTPNTALKRLFKMLHEIFLLFKKILPL